MRASPSLPPLQSLRAFESVGRLLSFRRAGEELLISQSAISHHVRQVEEMLGVSLFERRARSIALTAAGAQLLASVQQAFGVIAEGTAQVRSLTAAASLRVSVLPSFAANWLVPRLSGFFARHPHIRIDLDPTLGLVDLAAGEADLAIRYGAGGWSGVEQHLLMCERLTPVVSPALLQRGPPLVNVGDLLRHTLLLTLRPSDWTHWSTQAGFDLTQASTLQLTDYNIVLQAVLAGSGVALGRRRLIEERLRNGELVAPFACEIESPQFGYWLLGTARRLRQPAAQAFSRWISAEAAASVAAREAETATPPSGRH